MRRIILLTILFLGSSTFLQANNIQVSNVSYQVYPGQEFHIITFDIAWENSWRTSSHESNYDAAWVFFKFKRSSDGDTWHHGHINGEEDGPAGVEMVFPTDQKGMFIQRAANGIGDVAFTEVSLGWQLMQQPFEPDEEVEICVFAIEMVYIPEGPFQVGDGGEQTIFDSNFQAGNTGAPFQITSENAMELGGTSADRISVISGGGDDFYNVSIKTLPATFPKGFQAFYSMKYEISQGQYAAFLSSLVSYDTAVQRIQTFDPEENNFGYSIRIEANPNVWVADFPDRACNYLNWIDLVMYADWSGLRPMSELEYEKICRGPRTPVPGELAWGLTQIKATKYIFENAGMANQVITNPGVGVGNCNYFYTSPGEPMNAGWAAALFDTPTRAEAGASYYGVMEMTANVEERTITIGNVDGRSFDGSRHGDGIVGSTAPISWPVINESNGTIARGSGFRGGGFIFIPTPVSDRQQANAATASFRSSYGGGRLVRSSF